MPRLNIAFFASGNGSTFQYLAERVSRERINARPALLLASSKKARALERADQLGIPSIVVRRQDFETDDAFADAILSSLKEREIDFVCLAGYMKLVPASVVNAFAGRMLNVHPALLPAFGGQGMYGRRVHEAVLQSGARISGATIHLVDEAYDRGPIVAQQAVHVQPDDTPETLEARIHGIEVQLYYNTIRLFSEERIIVQDNRISILPPKIP